MSAPSDVNGGRAADAPIPGEITPAMHSAGMTVVHRSPFSGLELPTPPAPMSDAFIARWILPFYMAIPDSILLLEPALRGLLPDVTTEILTSLLVEPNWRPRVVGAFLVALGKRREHEDLIEPLLLRSDLCYAGAVYCLALARLNTPRAVETLRAYLRHYLTRPDLYFDQGHAMAALVHLDEINGTRFAAELHPAWCEFAQRHRSSAIESWVSALRSRMQDLATLSDRLSKPGEVGPAPDRIDLITSMAATHAAKRS